jgi:hypothetical protein
VDKDSYLLELTRYVVLNPVRANMVREVKDWPWSSYHSMTGSQQSPEWLVTDWLLSQFAVQKNRAIERYKEFVRAGTGQGSIWDDLTQQIYLGDENFLKKMQESLDAQADLSEIPRPQRRPPAKSLQNYQEIYKDRKRGMIEAYRSGGYTMKEIAAYFKVHYSTVSRAIKKAES